MPNHLYLDMKPGDRISRLFQEYIALPLAPEGYIFSKSQREIKKKNDFFENHISWYTRKYNHGNEVVQFDMHISVFSPKYRKWETAFYNLEQNWASSIKGNRVDYIPGWDKKYYDNGWYDLVKYDNEAVFKKILQNIQTAGKCVFDQFKDLDTAIETLQQQPELNLEKIVDFHILQNKYEEAAGFFFTNNHGLEERRRTEGEDPGSDYSLNRKKKYELRKEKLLNWSIDCQYLNNRQNP